MKPDSSPKSKGLAALLMPWPKSLKNQKALLETGLDGSHNGFGFIGFSEVDASGISGKRALDQALPRTYKMTHQGESANQDELANQGESANQEKSANQDEPLE